MTLTRVCMYDCVNVRVRVYVIRVYVPYRTHRTLCYTAYVQFRLVYLFTVAVIFVFSFIKVHD